MTMLILLLSAAIPSNTISLQELSQMMFCFWIKCLARLSMESPIAVSEAEPLEHLKITGLAPVEIPEEQESAPSRLFLPFGQLIERSSEITDQSPKTGNFLMLRDSKSVNHIIKIFISNSPIISRKGRNRFRKNCRILLQNRMRLVIC